MRTGKFNVSVISQKADFELFRHFGFQSGRDVDKFADFNKYKHSENGLAYITDGTNAYISAYVKHTVDLGSHTMFIGEITDMEVLDDSTSATYEYYMNNIKPQPQHVSGNIEKDGTGSNAENSKKTVWRCIICGYEYTGETLPEDFICPICKHPASDFEKVYR